MTSHRRPYPLLSALAAVPLTLTSAMAQVPGIEVRNLSAACGAQSLTLDLVQDPTSTSLVFSGSPGQLVFVVLGPSDAEWLGLPLPFPVPGLPGCGLYASGDIFNAPMVLSGAGSAALPLPAHMAPPPAPVYAQGLAIDLVNLRFAGASNALGFARDYASAWDAAPQRVMADYDAGQLRPVRMTPQELADFGAAAHQPAESVAALEDWLRTFVVLDDSQLVAVLQAMQREGFRLAGIQQLPGYDLTLDEVGQATVRLVTEARRQLDMPAHVAAIKGVPGIEQIAAAAFGQPPMAGCGVVSFPTLYGMSYRWPRTGWGVQLHLRRAGSAEGCFNYRHNFRDDIVGITPISPNAVAMVGLHGLGWRLWGQDRSLYYRGPWASVCGLTFVTMQSQMKIRR